MYPLRRTAVVVRDLARQLDGGRARVDVDGQHRQIVFAHRLPRFAVAVAVLVDALDVGAARGNRQQTVDGEVPERVVVDLRFARGEPLEGVFVDPPRLRQVADVEQRPPASVRRRRWACFARRSAGASSSISCM